MLNNHNRRDAWPLWTIAVVGGLFLINIGVIFPQWRGAVRLIELLQYDRGLTEAGEYWRLLTGNFVHWSREHFLLDVGAFFVVGLLGEKTLGNKYPWILLAGAALVGVAVWWCVSTMGTYRGLSGVDSAQFAALLIAECVVSRQERMRWLFVTPALAIFVTKILFECATGTLFFGTNSLGEIGLPVPAAHAAGAIAACVVFACCKVTRDIACSLATDFPLRNSI